MIHRALRGVGGKDSLRSTVPSLQPILEIVGLKRAAPFQPSGGRAMSRRALRGVGGKDSLRSTIPSLQFFKDFLGASEIWIFVGHWTQSCADRIHFHVAPFFGEAFI